MLEKTEERAATQAAHFPLPFLEFVALIALLMALTALSIDVMLPALPSIGKALGVGDENDRQLIISIYFIGFAAGQFLFGPISDRYGRKKPLLIGLGLYLSARSWRSLPAHSPPCSQRASSRASAPPLHA